MNDGELKPQTEETAEQLKAKITAYKAGESKPADVAVPSVEVPVVSQEGSAESTPEKATQPTAEKEPAPVQTGQAEVESQAPSDKKVGKPEIDHREWAKRKGIKDEESALRSLRNLEIELSRKNAALKALEGQTNVPQGTPAPQWQPQPQWAPQPSYQPAPPPFPGYPPLNRRQLLEQEAAARGWAPDDFEKVLSLANEISEMNVRKLKAQQDAEMTEIRRENQRNSEMRELMQDPLFGREEVQFEMHKVLEENPRALELEPMPRRWAFNEALRRMARKNLQEANSGQDESGISKRLPTKPPSGPQAPGPGFELNSEPAMLEKFQKGSAEEMKKVLTSIGARPTL